MLSEQPVPRFCQRKWLHSSIIAADHAAKEERGLVFVALFVGLFQWLITELLDYLPDTLE